MPNKKGVPYPIVVAAVLILLLIISAIVARPLFILLCVLLVFLYLFIFSSVSSTTKDKIRKNDPAALKNIRQTISQCERQIKKMEKEIETIKLEIRDVESHILPGKDIRPEALIESQLLISRFEEQLALRKTKITFYQTCKQKLDSLQANHLLAQKLEDKQKTLQQLQEN